jgi:hypothetical protein
MMPPWAIVNNATGRAPPNSHGHIQAHYAYSGHVYFIQLRELRCMRIAFRCGGPLSWVVQQDHSYGQGFAWGYLVVTKCGPQGVRYEQDRCISGSRFVVRGSATYHSYGLMMPPWAIANNATGRAPMNPPLTMIRFALIQINSFAMVV